MKKVLNEQDLQIAMKIALWIWSHDQKIGASNFQFTRQYGREMSKAIRIFSFKIAK